MLVGLAIDPRKKTGILGNNKKSKIRDSSLETKVEVRFLIGDLEIRRRINR